ncbi:hypothetical protein K501DRAFT_215590 [Backusella circina FSU 941]|nr:hypothetical protein K501DRAFT_215590 [Backusella circina FSU 941]
MSDLSDSEDSIMHKDLLDDLEQSPTQSNKNNETEVQRDDRIDCDGRTGFRIRKRLPKCGPWELGLMDFQYIPIDQVQKHVKLFNSIQVGIRPSEDWFTTGIVDNSTVNDDYCVTQFSDMRGSAVHVYVTGKAFKKFSYAIGMGSIISVKKPHILKPTEVNTPFALHVDQVQQMWVVGQSLDLVQCQAFVKRDKQCEEWTDGRSGEYCRTHLTTLYNKSKNGRMELVSGNAAIDIRWANIKTSNSGQVSYESKDKQLADSLLKRRKLKNAYFIKGKGLVSIEGKIIKQNTPPKKVDSNADKTNLAEFLKGRHDPGAEMIRQLKGIKEETPRTVLSNEALTKMGIGRNLLTKEEEDAKKRSFDNLLQQSANQKVNKKPRYVDI